MFCSQKSVPLGLWTLGIYLVSNHLRAPYVKYSKHCALLANSFFAVRHYLLVRDYKRTDYKQKAFFKRSFNGRKDKTVFYILKMFNKNILENPSGLSLIYSNSVY
ncbi:hypothetical protein DWW14_02860 [Bacteroides uniformis]|uniref:Uncharacterized protein n=1 Tax=Bacteroides uniformis TaxID=820 RepID=A0A412XKJ0_BACUN|nr:hypothetical protein DWW14_02860 [Bacteroides uniformis]RGV93423.1 hypothetical protein DWV99_04450 [Bacteroides uniformis]